MSDALFPFGYGLSYTTFTIGTARLNRTEISNNESIMLTIPVMNIGKRNGTEIVQVYVRRSGDNQGPLKTLKGFQRVSVDAGKTGEAVIELPFSSFEYYDRETHKMCVIAGDYEVLYGSSSNAEDLKTEKIIIK
jgi:beta-glucosidase